MAMADLNLAQDNRDNRENCERREHYEQQQEFPVSTATIPPSMTVDVGFVHAATCLSKNVIRDFGETLRNLVGGNLKAYADMMDEGVDIAMSELVARARARGADGVYGVRISTPSVTGSAAEIIIYGTAYKYVNGR